MTTTDPDVHTSTPGTDTEAGGTTPRFTDRARLFAAAVEAPSRVVVAFSALLTVLTWHLPALDPSQPGGDRDFHLFVALANKFDLSYGDRIATTYGPLFFLSAPSVINRYEVFLGFAFWFLVTMVSLAATYQALRNHISARWAWVVCTLIALSFSITPLSSPITASFGFAVILGVFYARGELPRWADRAYPVAMGVLVAAMMLSKFSVGLMIGPAALGAILARPDRVLRPFVEYAVAGVVSLVLLWILAGQPPLDLIEYVTRALSVGGSYAETVGYETTGGRWQYLVVGILAVVIGLGAFTMKFSGRRWLLWIGVSAGMFLMFKQGFIRHDSHSAQFFAAVFALAAVLAVVRRSTVLVCAAVVTLLTQAAAYGGGLWTIDPARSVQQLASGVNVVVSGGHRDTLLVDARAKAIAEKDIPDRFISRIGKDSVRVEPFDHNISWALGWNFTVFPTILNYGGWAEPLDELDRKWVADDPAAPKYLVRENSRFTLDNRFPFWDPPRTQLEQACRYNMVDTTDKWLLLERIPYRCGEERRLNEVTVAEGQGIAVPRVNEGEILLARVYPEVTVGEKIKTVLFRSDEMWLTIDGEPHRFPITHADAPLMMSAPGDESLVLRGQELNTTTLAMNYPGRVVFSVISTN